jgi:hypothetical protein
VLFSLLTPLWCLGWRGGSRNVLVIGVNASFLAAPYLSDDLILVRNARLPNYFTWAELVLDSFNSAIHFSPL